jgi:general secretion pathway protein G
MNRWILLTRIKPWSNSSQDGFDQQGDAPHKESSFRPVRAGFVLFRSCINACNIAYSSRVRRRVSVNFASGMSLLELIIAGTILLILTAAAEPLIRVTIVRQRESELRHNLREIRNAIDRYKDSTDRSLIRVQIGSEGYPPDLETLVTGVSVGGGGAGGHNVRFLRRIPIDPMTGRREWGLRSVQDDVDSATWGGKNVFDVYSKSIGTALDGTKYSDW